MIPKIIISLVSIVRDITGRRSPLLNTYINYFLHFKRFPNLKAPCSFSEKLLWLKLNNYNHSPIASVCADKYLVRKYVEEAGLSYMLNELYCVASSFDQIDWDSIPNEFVLKLNTGAGCNLVCRNKEQLDFMPVRLKTKEWLSLEYYVPFSEYQYKTERKLLLVEKFLPLHNDEYDPEDYKFYCFNGRPLAVLCLCGRDECGHPKYGFFMDESWLFLGNVGKYHPIPLEKVPEKPSCFDEMLDAAKRLSAEFPFARVDFYLPVGFDHPVFGEITLTPGAGIYASELPVHGVSMGDLLRLPSEDSAEEDLDE